LRVGLAAIILNVLLTVLGKSMPHAPSAWRAFFGMGLLNNATPFASWSGARATSLPGSRRS
jgi:hypothetical protein